MKRFGQFIEEGLTDELTGKHLSPNVIRKAKRMGLKPAGFDKFQSPTGLTYAGKGNNIIPIMSEEAKPKDKKPVDKKQQENEELEQTNAALYQVSQQAQAYRNKKDKIVDKTNQQLLQLYVPELFMPNEIDALLSYSQSMFNPINRYLYKGFDPGTPQPDAEKVMDAVNSLDAAFMEVGAPINYTVYTGLSPRYDYRKIFPGDDYVFRGYVSTSLDHDLTTDMFMFTNGDSGAVGVLLEIDIQRGQKAIYMSNITGKFDEYETLLPRGTTIRIVSGPAMTDAATMTGDMSNPGQIAVFKCIIVG